MLKQIIRKKMKESFFPLNLARFEFYLNNYANKEVSFTTSKTGLLK